MYILPKNTDGYHKVVDVKGKSALTKAVKAYFLRIGATFVLLCQDERHKGELTAIN